MTLRQEAEALTLLRLAKRLLLEGDPAARAGLADAIGHYLDDPTPGLVVLCAFCRLPEGECAADCEKAVA